VPKHAFSGVEGAEMGIVIVNYALFVGGSSYNKNLRMNRLFGASKKEEEAPPPPKP